MAWVSVQNCGRTLPVIALKVLALITPLVSATDGFPHREVLANGSHHTWAAFSVRRCHRP
jgi:hypothetical protein